MDWVIVTGGALYLSVACLVLYAIKKDESVWKDIHYYRRDNERGGYIDQEGNRVARKVLWREYGWYGVVILTVVFSPLLVLGLTVWERWLERLFAGRKAPVEFSGGDGSSCEAAIVIGADNSPDGIRAEYQYIAQKHGTFKVAWKRQMQMKVAAAGREYDLVTILLTADGTERKYWFDITTFSGKWR